MVPWGLASGRQPRRTMKYRSLLRLAPLTALVLALPACVAGMEEQGAPERVGGAAHAITVAEAADTSCSTTSVKGLSEQIAEQANCIAPGAFVKLPQLGNLTLGAAVFPYLEEPARDAFVDTLNDNPGTAMSVNSMLRTVAQQYLLYRWYQQGQCNIGLAAVPGNSNHESGLAVDVQQYNTWRSALEAHGFAWLGSNDPVHFDYVGPGAVDHRSTDVKAFQQLWNLNHPEDIIEDDGIYGPQTEQRLRSSPAEGFPVPPSCAAPPPMRPDVHPFVAMPNAQDVFEDGGSAGVVDLFQGETYEVRLEIKNKGGAVASNVDVGVWIEDPYLGAVEYRIESDIGHKGTFKESDANTAPENPPHGAPLEPKLTLKMNALSPGETKRITLTLQADEYSIGVAEAPDVRFWVQDVAEHYHQDEYDGPVTNVDGSQTFGERLQVLQQTDVYSRTRWEWNSDRAEGWTPSGSATLATDMGAGVLVLGATDSDGALRGPKTSFPADARTTVRLRAKRSEGAGQARLRFATAEAPELGAEREIPFDLPADEGFHDITIDAGAHPGWTGTIVRLEIDPLGGDGGTAELDSLRVEAPLGEGPGEDPGVTPAPVGPAERNACQCTAAGATTGAAPWGIFGAVGAALAAGAARRRRPRR